MSRCGFCSMVNNLVRRATCFGSRRGSNESHYRELGDQDTLKIEDHTSETSDDVDADLKKEIQPDLHAVPEDKTKEDNDKGVPKALAGSQFRTVGRRKKAKLVTNSLKRDNALLDDLSTGQVQSILDQAVNWRFDAFALDAASGGRCLPYLCIHLFQFYGLLSHFKLDIAKAWKLFTLIEQGYRSSNPYHNAVHATDVTQAMHCFLQQKRIREHLTPLEIMASLIAAMAHDMDHPGVNQPFLIATSHHLADLYKNTSVLENHHYRAAISCLIESGLMDQLPELRPQLERQIGSLILATDITRQQEFLSRFKRHLDLGSLNMRKADHRHLVLQIALKCADISNPCRLWEISQKWSHRVCEEFFRQGDLEKKLNLPVSSLCDRHAMTIPKIQTGFFKFVVTPLITEWDRFLQSNLSREMLKNLRYNENEWDTLVAQELAEETRTETAKSLGEDDVDTCSASNMSDSSELLLPSRRGSLNPSQGVLKEQLRRFSVPLNLFQDSKFKSRGEKNRVAFVEPQEGGNGSAADSEHSIYSRGQCELKQTTEKDLSTEKLLPESSIDSKIKIILKDGGSWKLVRQQTFPPLETMRDHGLAIASRSLHTSNEDAIHSSCNVKTNFDLGAYCKEGKLSIVETETSEPASDASQAPKEKKVCEVTSGLPQLLRQTLSNKDCWTRRRGSAPSPIAPSELRGLATIGSHVNAGRRQPNPIITCQQWLTQATYYNIRERPFQQLPRRSSLPVEVMTGISSF